MSEERKTALLEEERAPIAEQKRTALLRYLAVMFAVAFLLVLLSLMLQTHNSGKALSEVSESNASALSNALANAELLQTQNRELQEEKIALKTRVEQLEAELKAYEKTADELEAVQAEADRLAQENLETAAAYSALITAMTCENRAGNVTFSKAMSTVEQHKTHLSEYALGVYQKLLEQ